MGSPTSKDISSDEFYSALSRYPAVIASHSESLSAPRSAKSPPGTLEELDSWRLNTLPEILATRKPPHLTKTELESILQCKMQRGKRRAALPALVASNPDDAIVAATTTSFARLGSAASTPSTDTIMTALADLSVPIKGVGPATASYILAIANANEVPVFSDEGFRWMLLAEKDGKGWDRKIKYDAKEYRQYLHEVKVLREKLGGGVTAEDVEKVGFVVGKEAATSGTGGAKRTRVTAKEVLSEAGPNLSKKRKTPEADEGASLGASSSKAEPPPAKRGWKKVGGESDKPPAPSRKKAAPRRGRQSGRKAWVFTGLKG